MSNAIQLGPLLLPLALILVVAAAASAAAVGHQLGKKTNVDVDAAVWLALLVGLLVARLTFVYEYRLLYLSAPLSILNLRDGGWNATAGLVAAWLYALHRQRKLPSLARPLNWAMAVGTAVFMTGTASLAFRLQSLPDLPDLSYSSLDARTVNLRQFVGKPTVVNLWATWCPPCVREMPMLRRAQAEHPEVNFVFINQGESKSQVEGWLRREQLPLRNDLLDEKRQASATFQQQGYPSTLFFNSGGHGAGMRLGELSTATLDQHLQAARQ